MKKLPGALERETMLRKEAETLNAIARQLHSNLDLQSVLQKVTDFGTEMTSAAFGAFFYNTINEAGEAFVLYTLSGAPREAFEKFGLPRNTPLFSPTFNGERIVRFDDVLSESAYGKWEPHHGMPTGHLPVRSYLAVPVISQQQEVIGGLFFGHPDVGVFDEAAERVAQGIAIQAALAVENAQLYGKAKQEIEHRILAERAFRESESRFEQLATNAPVAIFVKDLEGRYTLTNPLACQALGRDDAVGLRDEEMLDPVSAERIREHDLEVIESRQAIENEELVQRDDFVQHYLAVKFPLFDQNKEVQGVCGVAVEITERRKALAELEKTRAETERQRRLYEAILNSTPDFVYVFDLDHRFTYINDMLLEVLGKTWDEAIGKNCLELGYPPWHAAMHDRELDYVVSTKKPFRGEVPFTGTHGTRIYEYIFVPVLDSNGEVEAVAGSTRDVTDRKQVEEATRRGQESYRKLVESLPAAVYTCDLNGKIELYNDAAVKLWGRTPDVENDRWCAAFRVYLPDGSPLAADNSLMVQAVRERREITGHEIIVERPDGTLAHVMPYPQPIFDDHGNVVGAINMLLDITEQRRAADALRESEERFRTVANNAPVGIFQTDVVGRTVFVNKAWCDLAGYNPQDAEGDGWAQAIHPDDRDRVIRDWQHACQQGLPSHTEFRFRRPDGSIAWLQGCAEPLRDYDHNFLGYIGTVADITARKLAEQSLSETERRVSEELAAMKGLHKLTEQLLAADDLETALQKVLASAIAIQQADMGAVHLCDQYSGDFHLAAQQGFNFHEIERHDIPFAENSAGGRALSSGERVVIEDITKDPDYASLVPFGERLGYRAIQSTPLKSRRGKLLGMLSTHFREPRKLAPRELWMLDLYARQAADFIEQMQTLAAMREADHRKDEFLAMLAHELRNPLAPIRTGLDYLSIQSPEAPEVVGIMRDQVEHLVRLVDDLLDVSRIARGRVELRKETIEFTPLVERAVSSISWAFQAKNQSLGVSLPHAPIYVHADPVRVVQVLGNLLNNATKYTPEGGRVELVVTREDDHVAVCIEDNGIGIERELLPKVFDLFTQSQRALDRSQGGMGIGLTLVRSLVELHDGFVSAESEGVGRGSRFVIKLPVTQDAPVVEEKPKPTRTKGRRILVVDDNFGAARMVSLLFTKLGDNQVEMAHDGNTALELINSFQPELVLLDIGLPGMDGYEVARAVRATANENRPFLVALTGYGRPEDIDESRAAGFDEHLVKPPSFEMLLALLSDPRLCPSLTTQT